MKKFSSPRSFLLLLSMFSLAGVSIADCTTFNLTAQVNNITCNGADNGSINITVTGGTTPYSFFWQGPNAFTATTEDVSGLKPGSYSVIATDSAGCSIFFSTFVSEPNEISLNSQVTNATCNGDDNGSINLVVSGGSMPYSYLWSNSATTEDISGLSPGSYEVIVTDSLNCKDSLTVTVTEPAVLVLTTNATHATCAGVNNGSIDLILSGGTGPYMFSWSNGKTTEDISAIGAGPYTVTVTDSKGCTATASETITEPLAVTLTTSSTPDDCGAVNNGTASVTASGGATPYTYFWSPGSQTTSTATNLSAGNYTISVTDANNCVTSTGVIVPTATGITVTSTVTNVKCRGGNDGAIDLTVAGGSAPYTFAWSNGASDEDIDTLTSQNYAVTITDALGCAVFYTDSVLQPSSALSATGTRVNPRCFNDSTGSITISPTGGTSPYTYLWSNGATTQNINNIDSGSYTLQITDINNCVSSVTFNLTNPNLLQVAGTTSNVNCNGSGNGSVTLTVTGGTSPYSYFWSGGQTTKNISGLSAGSYAVSVTDSLGCSKDTSFTITQPAPLVIGADSIINVRCHGGNTGVIDMKPTGGTSPYSYLWADSNTNEKRTGLTAGSYGVKVTDLKGCTDSVTMVVSQPDSIQLTTTADSANCNQNDATATVTVIGGIAPYTYSWSTSPAQTTATANSLGLGGYTVNIKDANNCGSSANVGIVEKGAPTLILTPTNPKCYAENSGNIALTVSGGTLPYTFLWSTGATTQNLDTVLAGKYLVTVTDNSSCSAKDSATITGPTDIISSITTTDVACVGGTNGTADVSVSGGVSPYSYLWSNSATAEDLTGLSAGSYTVMITDANNCKDSISASIDESGSIELSFQKVNVSCPSFEDGSVIVTVKDYASYYSFTFKDSLVSNVVDSTFTVSNLTQGTYPLVITDSIGCQAMDTITIELAKDPEGLCNQLSRPTSFTPNGDNVNDTWVIKNIEEYPENRIEIYNRWGSLMYSATGYNNSDVVWDGKFNGDNAPDATYYYILYLAPGLDPIPATVTIVR